MTTENRGEKIVVVAKNFKRRVSKTGKDWINVGLWCVAPEKFRGKWKNYDRCVSVESRHDQIREDFRRLGIEGDPISMTAETFVPSDNLAVVIEKYDEWYKDLRITNVLGPASEAFLGHLQKEGNSVDIPQKMRAEGTSEF